MYESQIFQILNFNSLRCFQFFYETFLDRNAYSFVFVQGYLCYVSTVDIFSA